MGVRRRISWVLWVAACTPSAPEPGPKSSPRPEANAQDVVEAPTGAADAKAPADGAQAPTPPSEEVDEAPTEVAPGLQELPNPAEPTQPAEPTEPTEPAEPVEPVEPVCGIKPPVSVSSPVLPVADVTTAAEEVELVSIRRGVLGHGKSGYYDVDVNGAFVMRPEINTPNGTILGRWPKNAWVIEERIKTIPGDRMDEEIRQLRLMRLRGERRWVPQMYDGEQRFVDDGQRFVVGTKGGMLAENDGDIVRVAGNAEDPDLGVGRLGELVGFFETRKGKLYTARRDREAIYVQRDCEDNVCSTENAMKLPIGRYWQFPRFAPRAKHSMTAVANVREGEDDKSMLLHYGGGSWKLERVAAEPEGLWGASDGGLWITIDGALQYRAPDGTWHVVDLPEGAAKVTAAIRDDLSEIWIAAANGEATTIYATAAVLPPPDVAPTP